MIFRKKWICSASIFKWTGFFWTVSDVFYYFIHFNQSCKLVSVKLFFPVWSPNRQEADLAVAGITITSAREKFVDFTKPFWNLGITILFRKPKAKPVRLFSFLDPFHEDVWVYMIAIYLCVSFMFFVIARLTPYEWCNPYPCNQEEDIVENQFSVLNSMWLTIGSILQQGNSETFVETM